MKKRSKKPLYLPVSLIAVTVIAALIVNLFIMTKVNSDQIEELGSMRIELIAADLQNRLDVCTDSLNKIGSRLSDLMEPGYTEEDLRKFLSEEKKKEIASTGRTCLNIFCVTPDGRVLISDMETPADYVLQDRDWYKALMSAPRDEEYISSVYEDAWTDGMCFTVAASFDGGKFLLGMDYNMNDIQSYISKMSGENYGDAMIVNSDGTIAGYTDESVVGEKISDQFADYKEAFLLVSSNSGPAVTESNDGGIIFGTCTENDWYLLLKISRFELYKDSYTQFILNSVIIIALVAVIAVFYVMCYRERCRAEDALNTKNKFISRMSDKFRTPLNKISEYADAIKESGADAGSVDMIRLEAANLGEMMDNILYYSDIVSTRNEKDTETKSEKKHKDLSDKGRLRFPCGQGRTGNRSPESRLSGSDYRGYNDNFVNISSLPYYDVYTNSKNIIKPIRDYDGKLRMCLVLNDELSDFSIIVLKDTWKMYGGIVPYALLYIVLFSICIIAINTLIKHMMKRQIKANADLKKAASAAAAADKAKSGFLARMSHEIRTPINAILGMNEMILRENQSDAIEEYALNISSAGNTLLALINEILDFSRIEDGKIEIIPVKYETASMISDLVNIISERAAEKGLAFELDIDPEVPACMYGDDIRIKQIITNLLTNAVKYTEKGAVRFTVKQTGINEENDDVTLYIDVSDTGIGIHEEDMSKLFDSFQRIDEQKNRNVEGNSRTY